MENSLVSGVWQAIVHGVAKIYFYYSFSQQKLPLGLTVQHHIVYIVIPFVNGWENDATQSGESHPEGLCTFGHYLIISNIKQDN